MEAQSNHQAAISCLKFYLLTQPAAPDARTAQDKIYELEVLQDKIDRETAKVELARRETEARAAAVLEAENRDRQFLREHNLENTRFVLPARKGKLGSTQLGIQIRGDYAVEIHRVLSQSESMRRLNPDTRLGVWDDLPCAYKVRWRTFEVRNGHIGNQPGVTDGMATISDDGLRITLKFENPRGQHPDWYRPGVDDELVFTRE